MYKSLFLCARSIEGNITFRVIRFFLWVLFPALLLSGCGGRAVVAPNTISHQVERMGYTIQIGAFKHLDNAEKLTRSLEQKNCDAYYFRHSSGLYKVRFGNFRTCKAAVKKATDLKCSGIIADYYIVPPSAYRLAKNQGTSSLRNDIVKTARNYKGIPYRWGGTSAKTGFDCSGLVMAVYRLNGLNLPRTSREQFKAGTPIARHQLKKGDLIFFATGNTRRITHVGIYTGRGRFIHAPGKGKKIRTDKLTSVYYLSNYAGARTYL
jgi:hypothetical protein